MKYQIIDGVYYGYAALSIFDIQTLLSDAADSENGLLITILDSAPNGDGLWKWRAYLTSRGIPNAESPGPVWIPPHHMKALFEDDKTFFGFDEVYVMKSRPVALPDSLHYFEQTTHDFANECPQTFIDQFKVLNATLYFSDGDANPSNRMEMNFAVPSLAALRSIEEAERAKQV